jgi:hypothetical protein
MRRTDNLGMYDPENPDLYYEFLDQVDPYEAKEESFYWDGICPDIIGAQKVDLWSLYSVPVIAKKPKRRTSVNKPVDGFKSILADLHILDDLNGQTVTTYRKEQAGFLIQAKCYSSSITN